jgi:hypothetical protein
MSLSLPLGSSPLPLAPPFLAPGLPFPTGGPPFCSTLPCRPQAHTAAPGVPEPAGRRVPHLGIYRRGAQSRAPPSPLHSHLRAAQSTKQLPSRSDPLDPNFLGKREAGTAGERKGRGTAARIVGPEGVPLNQGTRRTCSSSRSAERLRHRGPMAGRGVQSEGGDRARSGRAGPGRAGLGWARLAGLESGSDFSELTGAAVLA